MKWSSAAPSSRWVTTAGWVTAMDAETGAVRWKYHAEKPVIAGVTPTAGGITFTGDLAGNLLVFNSKTGELVHKAQTGGAHGGRRRHLRSRRQAVPGLRFGQHLAQCVWRSGTAERGDHDVEPCDAPRAHATPAASPADAAAGAPNIASGRKLYGQVCVSCHGVDGNMLADHKLSTLKARRDSGRRRSATSRTRRRRCRSCIPS